MVDRVFGSKDEIDPPFLFYSSNWGGYENKRKATDGEEDEGHVDQLGDGDEMFAPSTSKGAAKWRPIATASQAILEQTPGKRLRKTARAEKAKKPDEEGSSKGLINVLHKQVKLLQEAPRERWQNDGEIDTVRREVWRKAKGNFNGNN